MPHDSFLPTEYVEHRRDRRTSFLALGLFLVVVASVGAAFLYRQSMLDGVLDRRDRVLERYAEASEQVAAITRLQTARDEMIWRARLAAALVERVPRSILLADLIECMPEGLGLVEFDLDSTVIRSAPAQQKTTGQHRNGRRATRSGAPAADDTKTITVPKHVVRLRLKGLAPTDLQVSQFLSALNANPLLQNVRLESTKEDLVDDVVTRRFEITLALRQDADVRDQTPGHSTPGRFTAQVLPEHTP